MHPVLHSRIWTRLWNLHIIGHWSWLADLLLMYMSINISASGIWLLCASQFRLHRNLWKSGLHDARPPWQFGRHLFLSFSLLPFWQWFEVELPLALSREQALVQMTIQWNKFTAGHRFATEGIEEMSAELLSLLWERERLAKLRGEFELTWRRFTEAAINLFECAVLGVNLLHPSVLL